MEADCKRVFETIAPQQESHDLPEPIGSLSLHYEGLKWAPRNAIHVYPICL